MHRAIKQLLKTVLFFSLATASSGIYPQSELNGLDQFLFESIARADIAGVRQCIAEGADINARFGEREDTPLIFSVVCLNALVVNFREKIFLDPDTYNKACENRIAIIRLLAFNPDVDITIKNNRDESALSIATQEGLDHAVEILLNTKYIESLATEDELAIYQEQLAQLDLPEEIAQKIADAIEKLRNAGSHDIGRLTDYLKFIFSLPWNQKTDHLPSLDEVKQALNQKNYGLKKVKDKIIEYVAVSLLSPKATTKILCLVGPPGTGKTSIAKSVATGLGRKFTRISLGGVHTEAAIRGHNKAYIGAEPGDILKGLAKAGSSNPVFLLDEVDKLGNENEWHGSPASALLEIFDREQNNQFVDHYLDIPFDLSEVFFITTANSYYNIPRPLLDRMEIVELSSYTREEKFIIAKEHMVQKAIDESGLADKGLIISDEVLHAIIDGYTYESGVRKLHETIKTLCAKAARVFIETNTLPIFTVENLPEYLGASWDCGIEKAFIKNSIGVANGLYTTSIEGGVSFIETSIMPGKGSLTLTGNLGSTIKESANLAVTYARAHAQELGIDSAVFEKSDIHIHFIPSGGTDGPSAGIAMLSSIVSAITKKPYNAAYAMTGELSLTGHVLPIGGLKNKILAARRHGIKNIIIPKGNEQDLIEFKELISDMNIISASYAHEVLEKVLIN